MKHLLILISFLLLSSFVTSCDKKEETLYGWETSSGLEYKKNGDKNSNIQYHGEVKDGKPHGQGIFNYLNGRTYIGEFNENFEANGQGTFIYPDGTLKVGKFWDGRSCSTKSYDKDGIFISENGIDKGLITNFINQLKQVVITTNKYSKEKYTFGLSSIFHLICLLLIFISSLFILIIPSGIIYFGLKGLLDIFIKPLNPLRASREGLIYIYNKFIDEYNSYITKNISPNRSNLFFEHSIAIFVVVYMTLTIITMPIATFSVYYVFFNSSIHNMIANSWEFLFFGIIVIVFAPISTLILVYDSIPCP